LFRGWALSVKQTEFAFLHSLDPKHSSDLSESRRSSTGQQTYNSRQVALDAVLRGAREREKIVSGQSPVPSGHLC
jgi:hypothetical protein